MKTIDIYDPAMCCSSGVCGTSVDPKLVQFARDVAWLQEQGVAVRRFNLAQEPAAFAQNALVCEALQSQGNGCLPLVLVDGIVTTRSLYPTREQLASLAELPSEPCCGKGDGCCGSSKDEGEGCCGGESSGTSSCCCP